MKTNRLFPIALMLAVSATLGILAADFRARAEGPKAMVPWKIPSSIQAEHHELQEELVAAMKSGGQTADAAKKVAKLLHAHFEKEEEYALPPLGLLVPLAEGKHSPEMQQVIALTDKLRAQMPRMLAEHKYLVAALEELAQAAKTEGKGGHARFAEKLTAHAKMEEEVLYPAALLIGDYLKLKLKAE